MTINITPRSFGKIAAEAIRYGCDVSAYLVRRTLNELPPPATAPATEAKAPTTPAAYPTETEARRALDALKAANPRPVDRRLCGIAPEPEPPAPEPLDPEDFFRKF